jgi:hypothetical protein
MTARERAREAMRIGKAGLIDKAESFICIENRLTTTMKNQGGRHTARQTAIDTLRK